MHKERVRPEHLFVVDPATGGVLETPAGEGLRPSECGEVFRAILRGRDAGSVVHSHALSSVLAFDVPGDELRIERFEMLKGVRDVANSGVHLVPVIANTPREPELVAQVEQVLSDARFASAFAIGVRDHGAYIWGADVWEAKRHAEVYHFLFEGVRARERGA